jgi:hypothetical protein
LVAGSNQLTPETWEQLAVIGKVFDTPEAYKEFEQQILPPMLPP